MHCWHLQLAGQNQPIHALCGSTHTHSHQYTRYYLVRLLQQTRIVLRRRYQKVPYGGPSQLHRCQPTQ